MSAAATRRLRDAEVRLEQAYTRLTLSTSDPQAALAGNSVYRALQDVRFAIHELETHPCRRLEDHIQLEPGHA